MDRDDELSRRRFLHTVMAGAATLTGIAAASAARGEESAGAATASETATTEAGADSAAAAADSSVARPPAPFDPDSVHSNLEVALAAPRTATSMPGPFPGVVAQVHRPGTMNGLEADPTGVRAMLDAGMKSLTGEQDPIAAWRRFFSPGDRVGLKLNPIGGKLLANNHELVAAILERLEQSGVPRRNLVIWDRRQADLNDTGFTAERYPGITCIGTEYSVTEDGKEQWKGLDRLDDRVWYEFDLPGEYDDETMPYMLNGGTKSYFTRILTEQVDKVINVPVLKNAGPSVTLCLKNLAYGVTSNTARGHQIWARYIAEVCAFPPVRDKCVLQIVDGLRGCYDGGPGAVARYIWSPETIWVATDPVAADRIGWEYIFARRVKEGLAQDGELPILFEKIDMLRRAESFGLGVFDRAGIDHRQVSLT